MSRAWKIKLPFGEKDKTIIHISEAENGLRCNCVCPKCGTTLIARNANNIKVTPHFAHYKSRECPGSLETAIHKMAKQIITDHKTITTPPFERETMLIDDTNILHTGRRIHLEEKTLFFESVIEEKRINDFQPDLVCTVKNKKLLIEIKVTHQVDDIKYRKVAESGLAMIEIDLSTINDKKMLDEEAFKKTVLEDVSNRKWIFNAKGEEEYQKAKATLRKEIDQINKVYKSKKKREEERKIAFQKRREEERAPFENDLNKLREATSFAAVDIRIQELRSNSDSLIKKLRKQLLIPFDNWVPKLFYKQVEHSWIFDEHFAAWQMMIFLHYIQGQAIGTKITANGVKRKIIKEAGILDFVARLNKEKQNKKRVGSERGKAYGKYGSWAFTKEENRMIPSPIVPIKEYLFFLSEKGILKIIDKGKSVFQIHINSYDKYLNMLALQAQKKREEKERIKKRNFELKKKNDEYCRTIRGKRDKRINLIVQSEERALEIYGSDNRKCKTCFFTSNQSDSIDCPFCGGNEFQPHCVTKEHLRIAWNKYSCDSTINQTAELEVDLKLLE